MQSESGCEELRECQAREQVWCYASVYARVDLAFLACRQGNRDCREVKVKVSCAGQLYSKSFSTLFTQCTCYRDAGISGERMKEICHVGKTSSTVRLPANTNVNDKVFWAEGLLEVRPRTP